MTSKKSKPKNEIRVDVIAQTAEQVKSGRELMMYQALDEKSERLYRGYIQ